MNLPPVRINLQQLDGKNPSLSFSDYLSPEKAVGTPCSAPLLLAQLCSLEESIYWRECWCVFHSTPIFFYFEHPPGIEGGFRMSLLRSDDRHSSFEAVLVRRPSDFPHRDISFSQPSHVPNQDTGTLQTSVSLFSQSFLRFLFRLLASCFVFPDIRSSSC